MIQFFRQNNFFTALMLIPYTFIIRIAAFFISEGPEPMNSGGILYSVFANAFEEQTVLSIIVINLVIAFTAILVNRVVIVHRLSRIQSLIPGLIYVILVSWMESFLSFTAIHVANFFMMLGILSIFKFSKKTTSGIVVFDCLFYFGIATLFFTPYIVYLPICLLSFVSLNRFKFRDLINGLVGFLLPFFVVWGFVYYFKGEISILSGYNINTEFLNWVTQLRYLNLIPLGIYLLIYLIIFINYRGLVRKKELTVQKKVNILYYLLTFSLVSFFFINEKSLQYFIILALPSAILLGMVAERNKSTVMEEFFHFVTLVSRSKS